MPETIVDPFKLRFTPADVIRANEDWGANCGPVALAACLDLAAEDGGTWFHDVNSGPIRERDWEREVVPAVVASIPRADGSFGFTHRWEVHRA